MTGETTHAEELTPIFGRSTHGFLVASIGEMAFAMLPLYGGGHYLAHAWRLKRPFAEWTQADFYGHGGSLTDEAEFYKRVEEDAQHRRELRALGRRYVASRIHTPWGPSQGADVYADGIVFHTTASHGGFHLSPERNRTVHTLLRSDGWYEEDCEWAVVALTFPDLFTAYERKCADRSVRNWRPDAWEAIFGRTLEPGESIEKDRRDFQRQHAGNWIVISAIRSDSYPGFTETVATLGGHRNGSPKQRRFLVPSDEYSVGRFGFVIDEAQHRCLDIRSESGDGGHG